MMCNFFYNFACAKREGTLRNSANADFKIAAFAIFRHCKNLKPPKSIILQGEKEKNSGKIFNVKKMRSSNLGSSLKENENFEGYKSDNNLILYVNRRRSF